MKHNLNAQQATSGEHGPGNTSKKQYTRPMMVEIGRTKDIVQSYYPYNYSEDGYSRYYVYKS